MPLSQRETCAWRVLQLLNTFTLPNLNQIAAGLRVTREHASVVLMRLWRAGRVQRTRRWSCVTGCFHLVYFRFQAVQ